MRSLSKRLCAAIRCCAGTSACVRLNPFYYDYPSLTMKIILQPSIPSPSTWSATQIRCARFSGADVRPGNVIERRGKIYQVVKAQHTTQGRGGATIQVEMRDVDSGSKVNERLRTDEPVEKVYVQEKALTYLYTDDETGNVVLMDNETYSQLDVPKFLFGESIIYLQDDMRISVELYDGRALSASIPDRVTCTVTEAAEALKGSGPTPYKKVLLENGLMVQVPSHIWLEIRLLSIPLTTHTLARHEPNLIKLRICQQV